MRCTGRTFAFTPRGRSGAPRRATASPAARARWGGPARTAACRAPARRRLRGRWERHLHRREPGLLVDADARGDHVARLHLAARGTAARRLSRIPFARVSFWIIRRDTCMGPVSTSCTVRPASSSATVWSSHRPPSPAAAQCGFDRHLPILSHPPTRPDQTARQDACESRRSPIRPAPTTRSAQNIQPASLGPRADESAAQRFQSPCSHRRRRPTDGAGLARPRPPHTPAGLRRLPARRMACFAQGRALGQLARGGRISRFAGEAGAEVEVHGARGVAGAGGLGPGEGLRELQRTAGFAGAPAGAGVRLPQRQVGARLVADARFARAAAGGKKREQR